MRLFLTGFMGSGKTESGRLVASLLGRAFFDLDSLIEARAERSISRVFAEDGEAVFRALETGVLKETNWPSDSVVSTGGGCLAAADNMSFARGLGVVVWIDPSFDTIEARLGAQGVEDRPLFSNREEASTLYESRRSAYGRADLHLAVGTDETPAEVANRIVHILKDQACVT